MKLFMPQGLSGERQMSPSCCPLVSPPQASWGVGSDLVSSVGWAVACRPLGPSMLYMRVS